MNRQNIILGNYIYVVDHYTAYVDFDPNYKNYVVLKDSTIVNDVAYDNSVYFIEKDIIDECVVNGAIDTNLLASKIVYPITNIDAPTFSTDFKDFSSDFSVESFIEGIDINSIYSNDYVNYSNIPCDKIRIYLPITNPKLNAICCVYNYINNVHFYYLCRTLEHYPINSETEFSDYNTSFSEFYEIEIPNVSYLFKQGTNYLNENFNISSVKSSIKYELTQQHQDANDIVDNYVQIISKLTPEFIEIEGGNKILKNKAKFSIVSNKIGAFSCAINNINTYYIHVEKYSVTNDYLLEQQISFPELLNYLQEIEENNGLTLEFNYIQTTTKYVLTVNVITTSNVILSRGTSILSTGKYTLKKEIIPDVVNYNLPININIDNIIDVLPIEIGVYDINTNIITDKKQYELDTKWIKTLNNEYNSDLLIDLYTLTLPFSIEPCTYENVVSYEKIFVDTTAMIQNSISNNLTVCIYPYTEINSTTNRYVPDSEYIYNADVFIEQNNFTLSATFGFTDDCCAISTTFNYANKDSSISLFDEYCSRLNVTKDTYKNWNDNNEEYDMPFETGIEKVGYRLEIANDLAFKHIVFLNETNIDTSENFINFIDDFQFSLNNIFTSWDNLPEILVCRTLFIDKVTTTVLYSNTLLITKEQYKYLIQDDIVKLKQLKYLQNNITEDIHYMEKFNFIDKITCVVNKEELASEQIAKRGNTPKIIYKPIFFKVGDLQNLKIKRGLKQNIGVNLSDLMTKVDTFKMMINGEQIVESGRSDVYVLFQINAATFVNTKGTYIIVNQDDEYLSDGIWNTY